MRRTKAKLALGAMAAIAAIWPSAGRAQKRGGEGVERAGENAAELISELVGPVLIVLIGVVAVGAFIQRNVGLAITAALVGMIAGLFIFDPGAAESAFKDVYEAIF